jgi:hypothetical protein
VLAQDCDHLLRVIWGNNWLDPLAGVEDERYGLVSSVPVEVESQTWVRRSPQPPSSDGAEVEPRDRPNLPVWDSLRMQQRVVPTNDEGVIRARDQAVVVIHLNRAKW